MRRGIVWGLWFWGTFTVVAAAALVFLVGYVMYGEVVLDLHHDRAAGVVLEVDHGKVEEIATVRYSPAAGAPITTRVHYSIFSHSLRAGDRIEVEYDPGHPARARPAGTHLFEPLIPLALVVFLAVRYWRAVHRRPHRRGRRAARRLPV